MKFFIDWMQSDWMKALGWTFVHSLWQIAVIGLLLYVVLRLIPGRSAHVRYTISTMAIWLIVITALSTFIVMLPDTTQITQLNGRFVLMQGSEEISFTGRLAKWLESYMPMMLSVWLGGVFILMVRLAFSLGWVNHMRTTAIDSPVLQDSLNQIVNRLQLKVKPIASESQFAASPITIGNLKPLILFPIGIINQLTPGEVEAVLTHELAHIVRRDYLSNLVQSFIETLFYYHPVTWWISSVVREERENRADDLAVSWCGDHLGYAKALMTVQEMEVAHKPVLAIGFASRKGAMLVRIQRILHIPYKNHNQMEKTVLLSLCSLCFLAFTLTGNTSPAHQNKKDDPKSITVNVETTDTIPSTGTYRIHKKTDEQEINIEVENGDIKELKIDGKEIQPSDFAEYDEIIDELFGEMEAPPSMEGFEFAMPAMPPMPAMPSMPEMLEMERLYALPAMPAMPPTEGLFYEMPAMPPMPAMPEIYMKQLMENGKIGIIDTEGLGHYQIFQDSSNDGLTKIIILNNDGDSTVVVTRHFEWSDQMPKMALEEFRMNADEWNKQGEEWEKMSEEWKQNWEKQSENWQKEWKAQKEQLKSQERYHDDALRLRDHALEERLRSGEGQMRIYGLDDELNAAREFGHAYGLMGPRMNMSDAMVEEGLIKPGEEAVIQLTPDKLKINGKKMDDDTHRKYLKMYEAQQGIELTGNSRVEFKTKTRRSM